MGWRKPKGKHAGGRPKSEKPLCVDVKVRITADDAQRLEEYCMKHEMKRSFAIRAVILRMLDDDQQ